MFAAVQLSAAAIAALVVAAPSAAWAASPALTVAEVRELVVTPGCGGVRDDTPEGAALREHLVAKVTHESGRKPYAIRVENENRAIMDIATEAEAVREAMPRLERGETLGLGLGQNTHKRNLVADFGVTDWRDAVPLAFRPCAAIRAMVRHYAGDVAQTARVLDCASGAYWSGRPTCGTGYARSIAAIRAALPSSDTAAVVSSSPRLLARRAPPPAATVEVLLPVPADTGTTATNRETAP